ncbi:MAG: polysaccharide biosynthesis tyrosine autokinase [Acidobacteria bacterium]|nr:polysaccharide biosynthesis tyrosine autokinase [Acidobacteriota bacterium]
MSAQIPPEFEQKNPERRLTGADSSADVTSPPASGVGTSGAGYGYGYGYGSSVANPSELTLVHYLQVLYRRRYIAVSAFLAVFLSVALHTFTAVRIYEGAVRILIERENPNVVSFQEVLEQSELTDDYYETQYKILQSRALARSTIDSLDLWSHPQLNQPPRLTIRAILMRPVNTVARWFEPPRPIEAPDAAETRAQSRVIDRFLRSLTVSAVRYSRLVDVTFRSPDPQLAARVANALSESYIRQSVELRSSTTKEASEFLTQQLAEQRKRLEASEQALQAYRERTDSVSLEERQNVVVQRLADLNAAVTRANTARIQKEATYNQVKGIMENPAAIDKVPLILSNPFVQQQKTELAQLQRQRAQLSEKLGPNHPDMVKVGLAIQNAEARIQAEAAQIVQAMRSDYEAAVAEERTLSAALSQQKQEAQVLNRAGIQYGVLQRDATANRQMFENLLQRTQETGVSEELKAGNIRVVDPAETPSAPVSPDLFNNLLFALLGGLSLAVGLAFAFEYVDDRIKNPDEMKKHLGLPFLGMVPALFDKSVTAPLISENISSMFSESFRSIRTNVLFSSTDDGGRMIVVTSSAPGEGKTIVATNLSVALAQAGHRVLLIDSDMRKPRTHEVFSREISPGLSNLLVGNAAASEAIRDCSTPGLWLMPAGNHPPNPAELLGSKRFKDFTAFLLQYFDWIILDTPPVMAVTDASIVSNMAHGVLFVVGAEMTSRRVAQRAIEQLELGQAKFVGAVLNRVDLEHNSYYYSRYYRPEYGGYYGPPPSGTPGGNGRLRPSAGGTISGAGAAGAKAARIAAATGARAARVTAIAGGRGARGVVAAFRGAAAAGARALRGTAAGAAKTVQSRVRAVQQHIRIERHL